MAKFCYSQNARSASYLFSTSVTKADGRRLRLVPQNVVVPNSATRTGFVN